MHEDKAPENLQMIAQLSCGADGVASEITAMCWANSMVDQVLTGHDDGSIILWTVSSSFRKLNAYAVVSEEDHRSPVTSLSMVLGPHMSIVASGGNVIDVPDSVSLIHVAPHSQTGGPGTVQHVSHVPWFGKLQGFALVRPRGSFRTHEAPSAVITLTEGGYLCIQDIESGSTDPFVGDFQARVIVTSALALARP